MKRKFFEKKKKERKQLFSLPQVTDKEIPTTSERWVRMYDRGLIVKMFNKFNLPFSSDGIYGFVYKRIYVLMSRIADFENKVNRYETYIIKISDGKLLKKFLGDKPFDMIGKGKELIDDKENICTESQIRRICEEKL